MKIHLWAVGKTHEPYIREGIEEFTNRILKYYPVEWKLIPPAKSSNSIEADIKKQEADGIITALQKDDYLVLLDERGKQFTSPGLASFIEQRANSSIKRLVFLIGGAFGVDDDVTKRANHMWCLSSLVFPHQLVRIILAEQVYRACTIIRNEKYHHS